MAITRAKYGLIIIGDHNTLSKQSVWFDLLTFYRNNNLIFRGSIDKLDYFNCKLNQPEANAKNGRSISKYNIKIINNDVQDDAHVSSLEDEDYENLMYYPIKFF